MNLVNKEKSEGTSKRRDVLLAKCMTTLAMGLGVEITSERVILYMRPLADLTDKQLLRGFELALKEYKPYGGSFPSPGEIREFAIREDSAQTQHRRLLAMSADILERSDKPEDWEPMTATEAKAFIDKLREGQNAS